MAEAAAERRRRTRERARVSIRRACKCPLDEAATMDETREMLPPMADVAADQRPAFSDEGDAAPRTSARDSGWRRTGQGRPPGCCL